MNELTHHDFQFALQRCPRALLEVMKQPDWHGRIFVGGGYLRSIVAGDEINDIDVFVGNARDAFVVARLIVVGLNRGNHTLSLSDIDARIHTTDNAYTITSSKPTIQIIHRWTFTDARSVAESFDFTCCCAAFWYGQPLGISFSGQPSWNSTCDARFYCDVAAKRLVYRCPIRNEDAGGSMLRVLKYYKKGYRIPLDSLGAVMARCVTGLDTRFETVSAPAITARLREVDPAIDPNHVAHLPSMKDALPAETLSDSAGRVDSLDS